MSSLPDPNHRTLNSNYSTFNENQEIVEQDDWKPEPASCFRSFIETYQGLITSVILFSLAFLNVADRYIVGSVLQDVQRFFNVSKATAGLLQTIFLLTYMAFSPINGYLGDRVNRKYMLVFSLVVWIFSTMGGSFVDHEHFYLFVLSRCLFGVATASFETISVPIIGDRFVNEPESRFRALIFFNMGPPIGTGLAYLIGLVAKDLRPDDWRFSMRFSPFLLAIILFLVLTCYIEPKRGSRSTQESDSSFLADLKALALNKTYVLLLFSWTAGLASLGAFSWWSSTIIDYSLTYKNVPVGKKDATKKIYSLLQVLSGVVGLYFTCELSKAFKKRRSILSIDCFLLSAGFFSSAIFIYAYLVTIECNIYISMFFYMMTVGSFNMGWVVMAQVFLDTTRAKLRSTANAIIICVLHLIGDSVSPYWMGLIADRCISTSQEHTISNLLQCTVYSYYPLVFVSFLAATLALFMSLTFNRDKENAQN